MGGKVRKNKEARKRQEAQLVPQVETVALNLDQQGQKKRRERGRDRENHHTEFQIRVPYLPLSRAILTGKIKRFFLKQLGKELLISLGVTMKL